MKSAFPTKLPLATSLVGCALACIGVAIATVPVAEARPFAELSRQSTSPQLLNSRNDIRQLERVRLPQYDYQVFAPSTPTSGPQGIWKYGTCSNTVRVLVSNLNDVDGGQVDVTLRVTHSEKTLNYSPSTETVSTITRIEEDFEGTRTIRSIGANDHQWVEFSNVSFPDVDSYTLTASISPQPNGDNTDNNSRTVSSFVNHSCS
ncbi:MAG: hypothetical protein AB4050_05075 [Synechococcus sp.]